MSNFKTIESFEPVDRQIVYMIGTALGQMACMVVGLNEVDVSLGCGVINDHTRCLWTKDGHRIEVWCSNDGGYGAARSKEIDPDCPRVPGIYSTELSAEQMSGETVTIGETDDV